MRRPRDANIASMRAATSSSSSSGDAEHLGDRLPGDVVLRRTEPAAHEHGVGAVERLAQRVDDAAEVVAHLHLVAAVDARQGELLADPRRVRVDDLSEQELGADSHHLADHGMGPYAGAT